MKRYSAICAPKPDYVIAAECKPILEPRLVSWLAKAFVQRAIGALPNPHYWNGLLQDRFTRSLALSTERFEQSLVNCRDHLLRMRLFGSGPAGGDFTAFELGTGWFPTVALGFFLCGARDVWTWDIVPFVNRDRLTATVRTYLEFERAKRLLQLPVLPERFARLRALLTMLEQQELAAREALEQLGVHYRIGGAGRSDPPEQCVDPVASDVVLEYVTLPDFGAAPGNFTHWPPECRDEPFDRPQGSVLGERSPHYTVQLPAAFRSGVALHQQSHYSAQSLEGGRLPQSLWRERFSSGRGIERKRQSCRSRANATGGTLSRISSRGLAGHPYSTGGRPLFQLSRQAPNRGIIRSTDVDRIIPLTNG